MTAEMMSVDSAISEPTKQKRPLLGLSEGSGFSVS
jgi:hypothetical protein